MSWLLQSSPPGYADEQLSFHLSSLSTLPLSQSSDLVIAEQEFHPSPALQVALHDLSSGPVTHTRLIDILKSLESSDGSSTNGLNPADQSAQAEAVTRAVTMVWKEVLQMYVHGALQLEEERIWWDSVLSSRRGVAVYLVQTLPHRIFRLLPPVSSMSLQSLHSLQWPSLTSLYRPIQPSPSAALNAITSPYLLTRREMLASRKALETARNDAARKVGALASQGPRWSSKSEVSPRTFTPTDINSEVGRIHGLICQALNISLTTSTTTKRPRSSTITPPSSGFVSQVTPSSLLEILTSHLPQARADIDAILTTHHRPSTLTRLWFPLLFLPPTLYSAASLIVRNKEWMRQQVLNARETVRGFVIQWVWEPLEDIGKTIRGGGEGLGVAPTTVRSDQESLERMVMDLGRDYYKLDGSALQALGDKVRNGDMEEVLRVYEKEMQSPLKSALLGSLIRTLLIQVQKTKTDLSLSLLSLDHLLRSQQLTFAFVGVAPSVLILYGLGGWLRGVYRGEKRGKTRRRRYFNGMRSVDLERLLITSPKSEEKMSDEAHGLLIVSVSGMRTWAAGLGGASREAFLEDLRMVEDTELLRRDKLRVLDRIWRCWGIDGRRQ
ncbi:hypothetical protein TREMEDRAFT_27296 [Tremella mesenterica DSM 1558]|uniref:uncharacterized protein n=1 Tax=Tremella mesenterica (strain ATCC 24925 / CBS 8224 / DSM 1558 / NBRC 9311 / NRRL Y-6157 / RJB 2259-6 / UBC 559-6) TaxID=578456 RepID=UPI0003F48E88|nr:uncharacterized protein TREMEDRAFT_27296 [Tremella mesenterica DSM 1558]EIW71171.1 hypothetical protein TREMEDRAFT_27296 [Tremella mesenterica DSM 1558]